MTNEITSQTIKAALDHNDKDAWITIETQLNHDFPEQEHVIKKFLDGIHQVATTDNYQTYNDLKEELSNIILMIDIMKSSRFKNYN